MADAGGRRSPPLTDELGNGRFIRSLLEKAGQARDVRVMTAGAEPRPEDLVTIQAGDLQRAFAELTSRLRGYTDTPTLESAFAELDELIGLEPVKQQVRAIVAQLQVAKLRGRQGLTSQPPNRHFVFMGPSGTGKSSVAWLFARIFAAFGLLVRPEVVEAQRGDLVGEHLGATAIKTNKVIDSALGGVLFIDNASLLHNEGYSGGDAFGAEAVQTLLKRAEDDRDRLVIILADYPTEMNRLLRSNRRLPPSSVLGSNSRAIRRRTWPTSPYCSPNRPAMRSTPMRCTCSARSLARGQCRAADQRARQRPVRPVAIRARVRTPGHPRGAPGGRGDGRGSNHGDCRRPAIRLPRTDR